MRMNIQGKIWGSTSLLFDKNNVAVHRILGKKGGYCSKHKHDQKYNLFYVERGSLKVEVWKKYGLVDTTILSGGQHCVIGPGEFHKFEIMEDNTLVIEIYWTELDENDIVRDSQGGIKDA